jgi:DNA-binding NarL/FixJ family response regulator
MFNIIDPEKILVICDNSKSHEVFYLSLLSITKNTNNISIISSSDNIQSTCSNFSPDLIVINYDDLTKNVFRFIRSLHTKNNKKIPFIILTNSFDELEMNYLLDLGAIGIVQTNISISELRQVILGIWIEHCDPYFISRSVQWIKSFFQN